MAKKKKKGKKKMQTDVATKGKGELAPLNPADFGLDFTASDLLLPQVYLTQKSSKRAGKDGVTYGEARDSMNDKVICSFEGGRTILPFYIKKKWVVETQGKTRWEYVKTVDWKLENDKLPYLGDDGTRNVRCYDLFFLLPDEVAKGATLPYIVTLRMASAKAAQKLMTQMKMFLTMGQPTYACTFELSTFEKSNDDGAWAVFDIQKGKASNKVELEACGKWLKTVQATTVVAHEVEDLD